MISIPVQQNKNNYSAATQIEYWELETINEDSRSLSLPFWYSDSPKTIQHESKEDISLFCNESSDCHISALYSSFFTAKLVSNFAIKPDEDFTLSQF